MSKKLEAFLVFLLIFIMGIILILEGLKVESLVCQRGEKALNTCEIYQVMLWQKTSIKKFPLSQIKEAIVKEPQGFEEDTPICLLVTGVVTEEGELPFCFISSGSVLEKQQAVADINAFLKDAELLDLSVQELFNFSEIIIGAFFVGIALFMVYQYICFLDSQGRKKHLFKSKDKRVLKSQKLAQILVTTATNENTNPLNSYDINVPVRFTVLSKSPILVIQFPSTYNIFGTTEFQALNERLVIKHKLFPGITEEFSIPRDSLLCFEQCRVFDPASEQLTWKLQAITNHSKIKLIYDGFEKNCSWLGVTLADFYQVEFRQSSNEKID